MIYIAHRINNISQLERLDKNLGVELDLRDAQDGSIYISHNPYESGEDFQEYLKHYEHGFMILNIKSERIEIEVTKLLRERGITEYFFLDSSFPMIYLLSGGGEQNIALRVSEFEGLDTARNMAGKIKWIWIDCFTKIPINKIQYDELKKLGYKLCFVSPELEGRDKDLEAYAEFLRKNGMEMDAVCTKEYNVRRWRNILE